MERWKLARRDGKCLGNLGFAAWWIDVELIWNYKVDGEAVLCKLLACS
jgi:hypothetical protein